VADGWVDVKEISCWIACMEKERCWDRLASMTVTRDLFREAKVNTHGKWSEVTHAHELSWHCFVPVANELLGSSIIGLSKTAVSSKKHCSCTHMYYKSIVIWNGEKLTALSLVTFACQWTVAPLGVACHVGLINCMPRCSVWSQVSVPFHQENC
jgi:hypothetical protein